MKTVPFLRTSSGIPIYCLFLTANLYGPILTVPFSGILAKSTHCTFLRGRAGVVFELEEKSSNDEDIDTVTRFDIAPFSIRFQTLRFLEKQQPRNCRNTGSNKRSQRGIPNDTAMGAVRVPSLLNARLWFCEQCQLEN